MQAEEIKLPTDCRFVNLTGRKFSQLTVLSYAGRRGTAHYWKCLCDCGAVKIAKGSHVKDGRTRSCGCLKAQEEIAGRVFGRWSVIGQVERGKSGNRMFLCVCECGQKRTVSGTMLLIGKSLSCGCLNRDNHTTHGMSNSSELRIWKHMIERCHKPNTRNFSDYGGRGIRVCDRWRNSFELFLSDVGMRPSKQHSIDRFPDNNGNYEPGNTRWATSLQQGRNKRNNRLITIDGVTKCLSEWAEVSGVKATTIANRIDSCGVSSRDDIFAVSLRKARVDLTGKLFGRWRVLREDDNRSYGRCGTYWVCRCMCGTERSVRGSKLTSSESTGCKSCGHRNRGNNGELQPRHVAG